MAYYRRSPSRRGSYRTRGGGYRRTTRYSRTRRVSRRRAPQQRIVIQVVGGGGPLGAAAPVSLGYKSARPVRARF